ncbi:MAG: hypothetical protein PHG35_03280 [Dehalococcoidales bacterium]|nr:hypothetical protein [Dehalococcoidales bacterium]
MSFLSFLKKMFAGESADQAELNAARRRHGVAAVDEDADSALKQNEDMRRFTKEYDVWEEIDQYRWSFFVGGWVAKKIHPIGEDKVKRDLERLEQNRLKKKEKK